MTDAEKPETSEENGEAPAESTAEESVAARLEALEAEKAELHDRVLRLAAEMENLRKRTEREVRDAGQYAISGFARDMLAVGDNMRRAIEAVGAEEREAGGPALAALLEGVEMTERELLKTLERHNVRRIDPAGEKFDPNLHQAVFEVEDASVPQGTVAQVMQAGFTIGDRVLRPAMVGVSRGGPKPGAANAQADTSAGEDTAEARLGSTVNKTA